MADPGGEGPSIPFSNCCASCKRWALAHTSGGNTMAPLFQPTEAKLLVVLLLMTLPATVAPATGAIAPPQLLLATPWCCSVDPLLQEQLLANPMGAAANTGTCGTGGVDAGVHPFETPANTGAIPEAATAVTGMGTGAAAATEEDALGGVAWPPKRLFSIRCASSIYCCRETERSNESITDGPL